MKKIFSKILLLIMLEANMQFSNAMDSNQVDEDPLLPVAEPSLTKEQITQRILSGEIIQKSKTSPTSFRTINKIDSEIAENYGNPTLPKDKNKKTEYELFYKNKYNINIWIKNKNVYKVMFSNDSGRALEDIEIANFLNINKETESEIWEKKDDEFNKIIYYYNDGQKKRAYLVQGGSAIIIATNGKLEPVVVKKKPIKKQDKKYIFKIGDTPDESVKRNEKIKGGVFGQNGPIKISNLITVILCADNIYNYLALYFKNKLIKIFISNAYWQNSKYLAFEKEEISNILSMYTTNKDDKWQEKDNEFIDTEYWLNNGDEMRAYLDTDNTSLEICHRDAKNTLRLGCK